jgi:hypothetical protein
MFNLYFLKNYHYLNIIKILKLFTEWEIHHHAAVKIIVRNLVYNQFKKVSLIYLK